MQQLPKFSTWLSVFLLGVAGMMVGIVYLIGFVLAIPLQRLARAWLVWMAAFAIWGPLMYLALWHRVKSGGDKRLLFAAVCFILVSFSCLVYFWGFRLGLISRSNFHGLCATAVIAGPPIALLAYFVERKWPMLP